MFGPCTTFLQQTLQGSHHIIKVGHRAIFFTCSPQGLHGTALQSPGTSTIATQLHQLHGCGADIDTDQRFWLAFENIFYRDQDISYRMGKDSEVGKFKLL